MFANTIGVIDKIINDIKATVFWARISFYSLIIVYFVIAIIRDESIQINFLLLIFTIAQLAVFVCFRNADSKDEKKKRRAANKTIKKISRIKLCLRVASFISTVVAVIVAVNVAVIFTIVVIVAIIWLISLLLELAGGFVEKRLSLLKTAFIMDVTPEAVENKIIHPIDKERVLKIAEKYQKQKDKKKKAKMV